MMFQQLQTARLQIVELENADSSFILELVNTEGWLQFIGNRSIKNEQQALNYISGITANNTVTYWTVKLLNDSKIGIVTLIKRNHSKHYDIGFAFLPEYQKKGYAFESCKAVIDFICESTNLQCLLAITVPSNTGSIRLLEKLGLTYSENHEQNSEILSVYKLDCENSKTKTES